MQYINSFDELLLEGNILGGSEQQKLNNIFRAHGEIQMSDGTLVHPNIIINAVNAALSYIRSEHRVKYAFLNSMQIIYTTGVNTMAVDNYGNLYISPVFVYETLKLNRDRIVAVLMHETYHVILNHVQRGKNWLAAKGMPSTKETLKDNNLAADVEVNTTLVKTNIVEKSILDELKCIWLDEYRRNLTPFEEILEDEEAMKKLRAMTGETDTFIEPGEPGGPIGGESDSEEEEEEDNRNINVTKDYKEGYIAGCQKIVDLINNHDYQGAIDILVANGIFDKNGKFTGRTARLRTAQALEFMVVKSMDEFINEGAVNQNEGYETYDEGFWHGIEKYGEQLFAAMKDNEGEGGGGGHQGGGSEPKINGINKGDLPELKLPNKKNKGENGKSKNDNLYNIKKDGEENDSSEEGEGNDGEGKEGKGKEGNRGGKGQGQGGEGTSSADASLDNLGPAGQNTVKKKQSSGSTNIEKEGAGSMGSFGDAEENAADFDKILRDGGYSSDDIKSVRKITENQKLVNSKEAIERRRKEVRSKLDAKDRDFIKLLDDIEITQRQYELLWKEVLKKFLSRKTNMAFNQVESDKYNWKSHRGLAIGQRRINTEKEGQDPQDINVLVDVSGSVNETLLKVIGKSLVTYCTMYKYSSINVIPWASTAMGVCNVQSLRKGSVKQVTDEILGYISSGISVCGGGTNLDCALEQIIGYETNKDNKRKNDVFIVITDGETGRQEADAEATIDAKVYAGTGRDLKTSKNVIWMIYNDNKDVINSYRNSVKNGEVVIINADAVLNGEGIDPKTAVIKKGSGR